MLTSLTATTAFFLRPTTNRFVACSSSSAGSSPPAAARRGAPLSAGAASVVVFGPSMTSIIVSSLRVRRDMNEPRPVVRSAAPACPWGNKKPWCRSGPRSVVTAGGSSRRCVYLDQGTDLPSTALPVGALPCVLKAQMRSLIAVSDRSLLKWWRPDTAGQRRLRSVVPAESTTARRRVSSQLRRLSCSGSARCGRRSAIVSRPSRRHSTCESIAASSFGAWRSSPRARSRSRSRRGSSTASRRASGGGSGRSR